MTYLIITRVIDALVFSSLFVQGNWFLVINFMCQMMSISLFIISFFSISVVCIDWLLDL